MTTQIEVRPAGVRVLQDRGEHLTVAHAHELERDRADGLDPAWQEYHEAQLRGQVAVVLAWGRRGDWPELQPTELVGYAVAIVCNSLHYPEWRFAQLDALFVEQEWRATGAGRALLHGLKLELKRLEATELIAHAKPGSAFDTMLRRMAPLTENQYTLPI